MEAWNAPRPLIEEMTARIELLNEIIYDIDNKKGEERSGTSWRESYLIYAVIYTLVKKKIDGGLMKNG